MYLSGTKAPSRIVSSQAVARIPSVSHVCLISTLGVPLGKKACTILGAPGSDVSMPLQAKSSPHQGQAAKHLAAREAVTAIHALGTGRGKQRREVVANLCVAGRRQHLP